MNKKTICAFSICYLFYHGINAQLSFSINNFIHQRSTFTFLNEVDTKGALLEPAHTFGQHYFLTKENKIGGKFSISYGLGIGYTRAKYRYNRSEEFLSIGRENKYVETRGGNLNTMFVVPIGLFYELLKDNKSALYFNVNTKTIYALRTGIKYRSSISNDSETKDIYQSSTPINNDNSLDFTIGAALDYRRRISESHYWWKVELNYNYALTNYYTGTATLFGDAENLNIEIENKLTHIGLAVGILRSF